MTDRELLEDAARAAGIELCGEYKQDRVERYYDQSRAVPWNPLVDDGDALRLAVRLRISIQFGFCQDDSPIVTCGVDYGLAHEEGQAPDFNAATRRAIVRAAAEIGKEPSDGS